MNKVSLNEGQADAIQEILRRSAAGLLAGGALRAGIEVLRQSNPRYDAPRVADPAIVMIPRPVANPPAVPAMSTLRMLPRRPEEKKVASWFSDIPGADWLYNRLPNVTPLEGPPGAVSGSQVPLMGAGIALGVAGGTGAGYYLADKILRAADRRRARSDLDAAQREYQDATIGRAKAIQFPKAAADMGLLIDGGDPADPVVLRIKKALDRAYGASQILGSTLAMPAAIPPPNVLAPAPPPAPAVVGGPSIGGKQPGPPLSTSAPPLPGVNGTGATESVQPKEAEESASPLLPHGLTGWLYPGTWAEQQAPETLNGLAALNLGLAGGALGLGGWLGYQHARDKEKAEQTRRMIRDVDKANASTIPAPLIAQIVPVQNSPGR